MKTVAEKLEQFKFYRGNRVSLEEKLSKEFGELVELVPMQSESSLDLIYNTSIYGFDASIYYLLDLKMNIVVTETIVWNQ